MKQKIIVLLFTVVFMALYSCGPGGDNHYDNDGRNTGAYRAGLVFPADIPPTTTVANAVSGIDCDGAGICDYSLCLF